MASKTPRGRLKSYVDYTPSSLLFPVGFYGFSPDGATDPKGFRRYLTAISFDSERIPRPFTAITLLFPVNGRPRSNGRSGNEITIQSGLF